MDQRHDTQGDAVGAGTGIATIVHNASQQKWQCGADFRACPQPGKAAPRATFSL